MQKPEILSPIQDFTSLQAAIQGGCDAVYFGIRGFNMRAGAKNFTVNDLKKIVKICRENKVKTYLAVNTIIYQNELKKVESLLKKAKQAKVDAIICWDMAVIELVKKLKMELHISTQASVANSKSAEFYRKLGAKRIVFARECDLKQLKEIKKNSKIDIEAFVHGAMCVSVSGRCFLSQFNYNKSANRGECLQPCRRKYLVKEVSGDSEFEIGEDYILSPKDLCTLLFIEKIIESGAVSLKIEGRNRSPEYVKTVTSVYRQVVDFYFQVSERNGKAGGLHISVRTPKRRFPYFSNKSKKEFEELKKKLMKELESVYNRGFSNGFYLGKPINQWTHSYGSQAKEKKIHIGKVKHFYTKVSVAEIEIQANKVLKVKDEILILGPTTGVLRQKVSSIEINHKQIKKATQNDLVAIKIDRLVRANDEVYKVVRNK
ncbi:MAG: U32 family peptidase [Patescibacteria group bacterium]